MTKILRVGDPHVRVANIQESHSLMKFVLDTARLHKVDRIELLGDLFHTHAILRLEVVEFWAEHLQALSAEFETVVLVGNHDMSGDHSSTSNALSVYARLKLPNLHIIEKPTRMGVFAYIPYIHDNSKFVAEANALANEGATVLVSHTTYQGSKYDNGFYAPEGVDPEALSQLFSVLISGHVHSEQSFGRVWYPGTARWDTTSDANKRKGLWICEHAGPSGSDREGHVSAGALLGREFISTGEGVCTPIVSIEWKEGEEAPQIPEGAKVSLELIGSSDWISKEKGKLKGQVSIKTKITDTKREARKAGNGLEDYVRNLYVTSVDRERLVKAMKEMGIV